MKTSYRTWIFIRTLVMVAAILSITTESASAIDYTYDQASRLVQVLPASGSAQYQYDAANNLVQVTQSSTLTIADVTPISAPVGATVTITGVGFSTHDKVSFNGAAAKIDSATNNQLVVTVPSNATSGLISVTYSGNTATSPGIFTVTTSSSTAPTITSLSTNLVAAGDSVTITGTDFTGSGADLWVKIGGQLATITSATSTQITFTVPAGANSGIIEIGTPNGIAASAGYLYVAPPTTLTSYVSSFEALNIDGAATSGTNSGNNQDTNVYVFTGQKGQNLSLSMYALSVAGTATIDFFKPDGTFLYQNCTGSTYAICKLPTLPMDGTYTVTVSVTASSSVNFSLEISSAISGTFQQTANLTRIGQLISYTFNAKAGSHYVLDWSGSTIANGIGYNYGSTYLFSPKGILVNSHVISGVNGSALELKFPEDGAYQLFFVPIGDYSSADSTLGQINFSLNTIPYLPVDGTATSVNIGVNQTSYYLVNINPGENIALSMDNIVLSPANQYVYVDLYNSDGSAIKTGNGISTCLFTISAGSCNTRNVILPENDGTYSGGTYLLAVYPQPGSGASGSMSLTASQDIYGTLTDGVATTFATNQLSQYGFYTFTGSAGQDITLISRNSTFAYTVSLSLYGPDGTYLNNTVSTGGIYTLPVDGTYTVKVAPYKYETATGSIDIEYMTTDTGLLISDGSTSSINLPAGQTGEYTFTGTAGQRMTLSYTNLNISPAGSSAYIYVYAPGATSYLISCTPSQSTDSCFLTLPVDGTYTVRIIPSAANVSASLDLVLSKYIDGGVLSNGVVSTFANTYIGQGGTYTFYAVAGQNVSLMWSGSNFSGSFGGYGYIHLIRPDGSELAYGSFNNSTGSSGMLSYTSNLPETGTYTLTVNPYYGAVGSLNLELLVDDTGSIAVDGSVKAVSLIAGQNGDYTFSGVTGQRLGLGIDSMSTNPAGGNVIVSVIDPDHSTQLVNCHSSSCALPALPSDGTYTVRVVPTAMYAATLNLTLSNDLTGSVADVVDGVDATDTTFSTNRTGQNGRYTFNLTAGQDIDLTWNSSTFAGNGYFHIIKPDGNEIPNSQYFNDGANSSGTISLTNLQESGAYTVLVVPYNGATGQISFQYNVTGTTQPVAETVDGAIGVSDPSAAISIDPGATLNYTFTGTAGEHLGLAVTGLTTNPTGGSVTVSVISPDNVSTLFICGNYKNADNDCTLPALPSDGTYTVQMIASVSSSATFNLTLSDDISASATNGVLVTNFSTTRPGQNARYTFTATAGLGVKLVWSNSTFAGPSYFTVTKPDGTNITLPGGPYFDNGSYSSGVLTLDSLPETGTYTVFVNPAKGGTGTMDWQILVDDTGTIDVDGASKSINLVANRNGLYTFTGTAGQNIGLGVSGFSTNPAGFGASITIGSTTVPSYGVACQQSYTSGGGDCNLFTLPSDGTYTIHVSSGSGDATTFDLGLTSDDAATLSNGAFTTYNLTRAGQNGRYTFSGTAGQNVNLVWQGATFAGTGTITIYQPGGAPTIYNQLGTKLTTHSFNNGSYGTYSLALKNLPLTGDYTIFVDPYQGATGGISMELMNPDAGSLTVDGAVKSISLQPGQSGDYTFYGQAGQQVGFGISNVATSPTGSNVSFAVLEPDSTTTLTTCYISCNLPVLPVTGTYTIHATTNPTPLYAASASLTLSNNFAGTLALNGSAITFDATRAGHNGIFNFDCTKGETFQLSFSSTLTNDTPTIYVYDAYGNNLGTTQIGTSGYYNFPASIQTTNTIQTTGVCSMYLDTSADTSTGQITLQITGRVPAYADGDINDDGVVDVADVALAERIALGLVIATPDELLHGDVTPVNAPDGVIDISDMARIKRKVLGLENF